jgi:hypothetical protein
MTTQEGIGNTQKQPPNSAGTVPRLSLKDRPTTRWLNLLLIVQPLAYLGLATTTLWARFRDPSYPRWTDPDSVYLFNGLTIAQGTAPWHVEHPGTGLKIYNAIVETFLWQTNLSSFGGQSLQESVATNSETYLAAISITLVIATTVAMVWLGLTTGRYLSIPLALIAQCPPLLLLSEGVPIFGALAAHISLGNRPESFGLLLLLILFALTISVFVGKPPHQRQIILTGVILGILVSLKLPFALVAIFWPLLWPKLRQSLVTYLAALITLVFVTIPVLFRLPSLLNIAQGRSRWSGSNVQVLTEVAVWLPTYLRQNMVPIGLSFAVSVAILALLSVFVLRGSPGSRGKRWSQVKPSVVVLALVIVATYVLLSYTYRFDVFWAASLVPLSIFGLVISLNALTTVSTGLYRPLVSIGIAVAAGALLVSEARGFTATWRERATFQPASEFSTTVESLIAQGQSTLIHDYSVLWSYTPYVTECAALQNGDAFGREVAAQEVRLHCEKQYLAGFQDDGTLPLAPFKTRAPEARLRHALYCEDLARIAGEPGGLHIVTPDRDFTYIDATPVAQEGGWRLSKVNSIDCTGSPVRNETPNPATVAARERIANMPIIGFLYRNWPWQDELPKS